MVPIRCLMNSEHIMRYKDFGVANSKNGYYCTSCKYKELDSELETNGGNIEIEWQKSREIK